jgi:TPR repeat protein
LEILSSAGRGDAKAHLAKAIRPEDPARARKLLEEAVRSFPGHAIVDLSDMLIRGEGGTKDEKRALSLLRSAPTIGSVSGALGQLYLEGHLVPRDIPKALSLIHHAAVWEYEARLQLMRLLAENPEVRLSHGDSVLYDMVEAVELEEPGALPALIELKLSNHVQFGDKAGGCVLLQRAAEQGLPGLDRWEPHCAVH